MNNPGLASQSEIQFFASLSFNISEGAYQSSRGLIGSTGALLSIFPFSESCPLSGKPEIKAFYHITVPPVDGIASPLFRAGFFDCEEIIASEEPTPLRELSLVFYKRDLPGDVQLRSIRGEPIRVSPILEGHIACIDVWRNGIGRLDVNYSWGQPSREIHAVSCKFESKISETTFWVPGDLTSRQVSEAERINRKISTFFGLVQESCPDGVFRNRIC